MPYNASPMTSPRDSMPRDDRPADDASGATAAQTVGWLSLPEMRFQNQYVWFVFFSALDIMLTWAILRRGGREVNPVADQIIQAWGLTGAILFKFSLTILVVITCEIIARKQHRIGWRLSIAAMLISAVPVAYSLGLLLMHTLQQAQPPA